MKQKNPKKHAKFIQYYVAQFHKYLVQGENERSAHFKADLDVWTRYFGKNISEGFPSPQVENEQPAVADSGPYQRKLVRMLDLSTTICMLKHGRIHTPEEEADMRRGWDEEYRKAKASAGDHEGSYCADLWFWERYLSQDGKLVFPYPHLEGKHFGNEYNRGTKGKLIVGEKTVARTKAEEIRQKHSHIRDIWRKYTEKFMALHGRAVTREEMLDFKAHVMRVWTVYQTQYGYMGQEAYPVYRAECEVWAYYMSDHGRAPWPYEHWKPGPSQASSEAEVQARLEEEKEATTIIAPNLNDAASGTDVPSRQLHRNRISQNRPNDRQTMVSPPPARSKSIKIKSSRLSTSAAPTHSAIEATGRVIEENSEAPTNIELGEVGEDEVECWYEAMLKNLESGGQDGRGFSTLVK